jgi:NitT/TauT family transport system permease protein
MNTSATLAPAAAVRPPPPRASAWAALALALALLALSQPAPHGPGAFEALLLAGALAGLMPVFTRPGWTGTLLGLALPLLAAVIRLITPATEPTAADGLAFAALGCLAWLSVQRLAHQTGGRWLGTATAGLFGLWLLCFWQLLIVAFDVPRVLLPAPSLIAVSMWENLATLAGDFVQTVLKSVLIGVTLGTGAGVLCGIAIDRAPFLQRGLLPLASLTSTVPLVGVAPIAVMWFGFDWPSKAAVIVLMTFFPALINTLAGLSAAGRLERELMHSYASPYARTLLWLRLPCAMPFIFNALKVNTTLALIGAIVAEYFGSPTAGLGFRISTEAARMNMPLVWAAIVVASVTGSLLYALLTRLERRINFWHPSVRSVR